MITTASEHIKVEGHIGRWHVIDTAVRDDKEYFLMEHDTYGDEAAMLIVDSEGCIVLDDVWNGFDDLDYYFESQAEAEEMHTIYEVTSVRDKKTGKLTCTVTDSMESDIIVEGIAESHKKYDIYTDWFNTKEEAEQFVRANMEAE